MSSFIPVGIIDYNLLLTGPFEESIRSLFKQAHNANLELVIFPHVEENRLQQIQSFCKDFKINSVLSSVRSSSYSDLIIQIIINKMGEIVTKRRAFSLNDFNQFTSSDLESVSNLPFTNFGLVEVGANHDIEHLIPLMNFNSATLFEKIHIGFFLNTETGFITHIDSIARSIPQMTQTFHVFITDDLSKCSVFTPSGDELEPNGFKTGLKCFNLDMDEILYQKQMVDIVGHYSRPDMMSLKIQKE